ncbi:hypothetical protein GGR52DRAFT_556834 [Hypoxylon sp. FL1284]|nr:hypothetical protein GGR52DRAFT_556834 [Hypoxylon sp. FL1284]
MSTPRTLAPRRLLRSRLSPRRHPIRPSRSFITLPDSAPQQLTAARRLPYAPARLFELIADVDSYTQFLPYCQVSRVTRWTDADVETGRRWPARADLTAGWGGFEETYTSRVFCVPGLGVVEAVSGDADSEIPADELRRHGLLPSTSGSADRHQGGGGGGVFQSLVTRWTVEPAREATRADRFQRDWSDVHLSIRYRFANPLYAAVSSAVADKVAPVMIEAFVERAKKILGDTGKDAETLR